MKRAAALLRRVGTVAVTALALLEKAAGQQGVSDGDQLARDALAWSAIHSAARSAC